MSVDRWESPVAYLRTTHARDKAGNLLTFDDIVRRRGKFPSPAQHWYTSDVKRGPIERVIRAEAKERGVKLVVNCMGLRTEESTSRANKMVFLASKRLTYHARSVFDWLPIHRISTDDVFNIIKRAGHGTTDEKCSLRFLRCAGVSLS
jgi:3'-phosphoadenosine 5'-phosphosulfate sulfotransferase (PAPS reductase)/FAD synthetase